MKNSVVIASQESDHNALLWMQDKEREYRWLGSRWIDLLEVSPKGRAERERASQTQNRSVYGHTRNTGSWEASGCPAEGRPHRGETSGSERGKHEYRSDTVLRDNSSIETDSKI